MQNYKNTPRKYLIFSVLAIFVFLRIVFYKSHIPEGAKVRITTTVLTDPIKYDNSQYFKVSGLKIYLPLFPEISYGDKIVVVGETKNGFLKNAKLVEIYPASGKLFVIRKRVLDLFKETLPEPYAGLTSGIVIGDKAALTSEFWEQVRRVGVAHVVVASGTNVSFVVSFMVALTAIFSKRRKMIAFVIFGIVLYITISGFQAPIIRAGLMSVALLVGQLLGRAINPWRMLIFMACAMLIVNPTWAGDIGFILSFVSTASLMLFEKKITKIFIKLPFILREGLATSLAAQIGVAPILFVTFGQFYIWSPVVNALVLWTVPFIMIFGSMGAILGLIYAPLGKALLLMAYPFTLWFVKITELFAG